MTIDEIKKAIATEGSLAVLQKFYTALGESIEVDPMAEPLTFELARIVYRHGKVEARSEVKVSQQ